MTITAENAEYLDAMTEVARAAINKMLSQPPSIDYEVSGEIIAQKMAIYAVAIDKCTQNLDARAYADRETAGNAMNLAAKLATQTLHSIQVEYMINQFRIGIYYAVVNSPKNCSQDITFSIRRTIEVFVEGVSTYVGREPKNDWCKGIRLIKACVELLQALMDIPLPVQEVQEPVAP